MRKTKEKSVLENKTAGDCIKLAYEIYNPNSVDAIVQYATIYWTLQGIYKQNETLIKQNKEIIKYLRNNKGKTQ